MATEFDLDCVEQVFTLFGFSFTGTNRELLRQSLIAAGSQAEDYDGNRRLARVGEALIDLVVIQGGYEKLLSRADLNTVQNEFGSKDWCAAVADRTGITACIKLCERSGPPSKNVKGYAINAIIGAMWIDSGESYKDVIRVLGTVHHFISHTPHLSNVLLMSRSFERRERHEIPLASNSQISSATFEQFVGSPSQLLMDQGSTASEQEDVSLLRDSIPFDPPRSESADDERSDSAIEFLLSNPQTNTSLLSVPILENAHIDDTFSTVTHVTALRSPDQTSTLVTDIGWFRTYVTEDEQRCAEYNLSNPWLAPRAQTLMQKLAEYPDQHRAVFLKIWAGVCSTFSVISLQETMQTLRRGICAELLPPNLDLSVNDRLQLIESAEKCVTGLLLVRRLHVLQLLKDEPRTANGVTWINFDISSGSTKTRRPGNPLIVQESAVTKSLMERFYPDLGPSSTEYRKVYEKLKKLRKLGRRLEMLASNFGTGILGLLPCSDFDSQGFNIAVSDNALLKPTDDEFSCFMTLLDSTEGDMLRKFSCAAAPIVDGIFAGDLSRIDQYPLQQLQAEKISKLPRCSEPLLACFAGNMSTQLQDGSSSGS